MAEAIAKSRRVERWSHLRAFEAMDSPTRRPQAANSVKRCAFWHKESDGQPFQEADENFWKRFCCLIEEFQAIRLRIPGYRAAEIQVDFSEGQKNLGTKALRGFLKRYITPCQNREKKGPSQGVI